jgi:DNA-binding NarL/FixJ family response regulator
MHFVTRGLRPPQSAHPLVTWPAEARARKSARTQLLEIEDKVLACLAAGSLYKEIPGQLGITDSQFRSAQRAIFSKLHAQNRTEAVLRWQGLKPH